MSRIEQIFSVGLKAGEISGVTTVVGGLLTGNLVELEVGVGLTAVAMGVDRAKDLIKKRSENKLEKDQSNGATGKR